MFDNQYEPDNILQSLWDATTTGGCLCTMRESCSWCNYDARYRRKEIETRILQEAKDKGYQIYLQRGEQKVNFEYVTKVYNLK